MARKNYMNIAFESVFGTAPATGWTGLVVEDLGGHNPVVANQQAAGMMYGQQGPLVSGRRTNIVGGGGEIKPWLEFSSLAMLMLLELSMGAPDVDEVVADEVWSYAFSTGKPVSTKSLASQVGREFKDGTQDRDTFVGGQVETWTLAQGMGPSSSGTSDEGLVKSVFKMNYRTLARAVAEHLPTYSSTFPYAGSDWTHSVGPDLESLVAECLDSWGLEFSPGLAFEDAKCATSAIRDKAGPGAMPSIKVTGAASYKNREMYDAWLDGDVLALRARWEPAGVFLDTDETVAPSFTVEIPAFGMDADPTPKEQKEGATKQDLPRMAMWNGTDDMMTVTVVTDIAPA